MARLTLPTMCSVRAFRAFRSDQSTGIINLDFADVKAVMESGGMAHLGIGHRQGEKAMADAAQNAISSPMLETSIDGARAVLINVTCNSNCSIVDINDAVEMITAAADSEANIIFRREHRRRAGRRGAYYCHRHRL